MEVDEASQLIGIFGLYALFRLLVPRHIEPDYDLFARLWKVQERVPVVLIFGRVVWAPDEFLTRFAHIKAMNVKKLQPRVSAQACCFPPLSRFHSFIHLADL
jgi:hypothetical protein